MSIILLSSQIVKNILVILKSPIYFTIRKVYNGGERVIRMLKLRELRKNCGLTMKELGAEIGVAESTISQYETGKRQPDYETLLKLGEFFGVSVDYLLTGDENKKAPTPEGEREIDDRKMKAAFLGGLADGLSEEEIDEYWDDARDYIGYKIQQKRSKSD